MRILGLIPARGGSKQIKKKNIINLSGKTLLEYSILSALKSKYLDKVLLSTDNDEIASVGRKFNIGPENLRPKKYSTDSASTWSVVHYELTQIEKKKKEYFDYVMLLQPTTPFRSTSLIDKACQAIEKYPQAESIVSIVNVGANHPYRMYEKDKFNRLKSFVKNVKDPMMARQLLPPIFIRSGDIYLTKRSCIFEKKSLIGNHSIGLEVSTNKTINIDTEQDLIVAEHIMKNKKNECTFD